MNDHLRATVNVVIVIIVVAILIGVFVHNCRWFRIQLKFASRGGSRRFTFRLLNRFLFLSRLLNEG